MATWAVEKRGHQWLVSDREALLRLARTGALSGSDRVRGPDDEAWCAAEEHPDLREAFDDDLWAAWDDLHDDDPDALWQMLAVRVEDQDDLEDAEHEDDPPTVDAPARPRAVEAPAPPPPTMTLAVVRPPPKKKKKKPRSPTPAARSVPTGIGGGHKAVVSGGNRRSGGARAKVIAFPDQGRGRIHVTLPNEVSATPLPVEATPVGLSRGGVLDLPPPPDPRAFNAMRVGAMAAPFVLGFLFLLWWVPHTATIDFSQDGRPSSATAGATLVPPKPADGAEVAGAPSGAVEPAETPADLYDALLTELRSRMADGAIDIDGEDGLETALLVELSRLGLDIESVKANVRSWVGSKSSPVPEEVEIQVSINTRGDLERELASVGLVVGKYVLQYGLAATVFEVRLVDSDGRTRVRSLSPTAAARLYGGRSDLVTFLLEKP